MPPKPAFFQLFPDRLPAWRAERPSRRIELNPVRDPHARAALEAYADACEPERPDLAARLREARYDTVAHISHCVPTVLRVFGLAQAAAAERPDYAHAAWEHVKQHLALALADTPEPDAEPPLSVCADASDAHADARPPGWLAAGLPEGGSS